MNEQLIAEILGVDGMTVTDLAREMVAANDARLDGHMTRENHAIIVQDIYRKLAGIGKTWADLETACAAVTR
jgi:hypothetical protein